MKTRTAQYFAKNEESILRSASLIPWKVKL